MPLYMDHHKNIEGLTTEAVADAHQRDLETQGKYGAEILKYWFNEENGRSSACSTRLTRRPRRPFTARPTGLWPTT